jgi:predicted nucleic acid-binding protein
MKKLKPGRKYLVIDACVARSAGETQHPVSSACRDFLDYVLEFCHNAVASEELMAEWKHHQSRFTRKWRFSMAARRKPLRTIETQPLSVDFSRFSEKAAKAIEKDLFLLETAMAADKIIVTLDQALYDALGTVKHGEKLRKALKWHDPIKSSQSELLS